MGEDRALFVLSRPVDDRGSFSITVRHHGNTRHFLDTTSDRMLALGIESIMWLQHKPMEYRAIIRVTPGDGNRYNYASAIPKQQGLSWEMARAKLAEALAVEVRACLEQCA